MATTYEYEFETLNFSARDGNTLITIRDGKLSLAAEPDAKTLALIERYGGKLVEAKAAVRKSQAEAKPVNLATKKDGDQQWQ